MLVGRRSPRGPQYTSIPRCRARHRLPLLTGLRSPENMRAMERMVLAEILGNAPGVEREGDAFKTASGHRLSFYVGQPGQAMVIGDVVTCQLQDSYLELVTRETGATIYLAYDAIHGLSRRPPDPKEERRAGFS